MKKIGLTFVLMLMFQALVSISWAQNEEMFNISSCFVYESDNGVPIYNGVSEAQVWALQEGVVKYKGISGQYGGIELNLPRGQKFSLKIFKNAYDTLKTPEYTVPNTEMDYGDEFLIYKQFFLPINLGPSLTLKGNIIDGDSKYDGFEIKVSHIASQKSYRTTILDNAYEFARLPVGESIISLENDTLGIKNVSTLSLEGEGSTISKDLSIGLVAVNLSGRTYDVQDQTYIDGVDVLFIKGEDTLAKITTTSLYLPPDYKQIPGYYEYKGFRESGSIRILAKKTAYQSMDTTIQFTLQDYLNQRISKVSLLDIKLLPIKDTITIRGSAQYYQNGYFAAAGVHVELWNSDTSILLQQAVTDADGSFEMKHSAYLSEKFYIKAKGDNYVALKQEKIFTSFDEQLTLYMTLKPKPMYAVVGLSVSQLLNTPHVSLTWQKDERAESYKVDRYNIQRKSSDDTYFNQLGIVSGKEEMLFVDTSAKYDIEYQYKVDVYYSDPSGVAYYGNDSAKRISPIKKETENMIDVEYAYVYEEGASFISKAAVYALRGGKIESAGYTDQYGTIVLSLLSDTYYQLKISKKGFFNYTSDSILSNDIRYKSFYLKPDYGETMALKGSVSFAEGNLDGTNLFFYHNESERTFRTTLVDNAYFFNKVSLGSGRLILESDTLAIEGGAYLYVNPQGSDTMSYDIKVIRDGLNVYGYTFFAPTYKKMNNIVVCLTQGNDTLFCKVSESYYMPPAYEQENGYYNFNGLRRGGNVKMSAYAEGYSPWDTTFNLDLYAYAQEKVSKLRLPDVKLNRVSGTIEQEGFVFFQNATTYQTDPVSDASVELWSADTNECLTKAVSDEQGAYRISHQGYIIDQPYVLLIQAEGFVKQYIPLEFSSFKSTYNIYMNLLPKPLYSVIDLKSTQIVGKKAVQITWALDQRAALYEVSRYIVHKKLKGEMYFNQIASIAGSEPMNFVDTAVQINSEYCYKVDIIYSQPIGTAFYPVEEAVCVSIAAPSLQYVLNLSSNDTNWGSVSGAGTYQSGDSVTITAHPKKGFRFLYYKTADQILSQQVIYGFRIMRDITITAVFEPLIAIEDNGLENLNIFSDGLVLRINNPQSALVEISVSDLLGRTVYTGKSRENLYLKMPNTGIYLLRLTQGIKQLNHKIFVR